MIDEKILVSKAKSGDMRAYEDLIGLYEKKVFSTIYYMTKNKEDVEDIAQEVFIKIFKNLKNFKEQSSLYTWIYRITINVCIDELKKSKNVIYLDDTLKTENGEIRRDIEDTSKKPDEIAEDRDISARLETCIRKMPYEQRIMVVLRDIKGFTYMEIAEILKMNLGTVKSKISRARDTLKNLLIEDGTFIEYSESNK